MAFVPQLNFTSNYQDATHIKRDPVKKATAEVNRAQAWYENSPYDGRDPEFVKYQKEGAVPKTSIPIAMEIVDQRAYWLFSKTPQLISHDANLQEMGEYIWSTNELDRELPAWARENGMAGFGWVKVVYDDDPLTDCPWPMMYYDKSKVIAKSDPKFPRKLLSVRISYQLKDEEEDEWVWYSEKWTRDRYEESFVRGGGENCNPPDNWEDITPETSEVNPYGIIPVFPWANIKDHRRGNFDGRGDLDGLYQLLNRVNIMNDSNDMAVQTMARNIWIAKGFDPNKPLNIAPGAVIYTDEMEATLESAKFHDPHLDQVTGYIQFLENQAKMTAGIVDINPAEVKSLGRLSSLTLRQLKDSLVRITEEKRRNAEAMLVQLFQGIAKMARKIIAGAEGLLPELPKYSIHWPLMFELSPEEIAVMQNALLEAYNLGGISEHEMRHKIAELYGIRNTPERDEVLDAMIEKRKQELAAQQEKEAKLAAQGVKPKPKTDPTKVDDPTNPEEIGGTPKSPKTPEADK